MSETEFWTLKQKTGTCHLCGLLVNLVTPGLNRKVTFWILQLTQWQNGQFKGCSHITVLHTDYLDWGKIGVWVPKIRVPRNKQQSQKGGARKEGNTLWLDRRLRKRGKIPEIRVAWRQANAGDAQGLWPAMSRISNYKEMHSINQHNFLASLPKQAMIAWLGWDVQTEWRQHWQQNRWVCKGNQVWQKLKTCWFLNKPQYVAPLQAGFSPVSPWTAVILSFLLVLLSTLWPTLGRKRSIYKSLSTFYSPFIKQKPYEEKTKSSSPKLEKYLHNSTL